MPLPDVGGPSEWARGPHCTPHVIQLSLYYSRFTFSFLHSQSHGTSVGTEKVASFKLDFLSMYIINGEMHTINVLNIPLLLSHFLRAIKVFPQVTNSFPNYVQCGHWNLLTVLIYNDHAGN